MSLKANPFDQKKPPARCVYCGRNLDMNAPYPPPQWFGRYENDKMIAAICRPCVQQPAIKERWDAHDVPEKPDTEML